MIILFFFSIKKGSQIKDETHINIKPQCTAMWNMNGKNVYKTWHERCPDVSLLKSCGSGQWKYKERKEVLLRSWIRSLFWTRMSLSQKMSAVWLQGRGRHPCNSEEQLLWKQWEVCIWTHNNARFSIRWDPFKWKIFEITHFMTEWLEPPTAVMHPPYKDWHCLGI